MEKKPVNVGIRENGTNKLISVYPYKIDNFNTRVKDEVMAWYYQKNCEAEENMENCFVDVLSEKELKSIKD